MEVDEQPQDGPSTSRAPSTQPPRVTVKRNGETLFHTKDPGRMPAQLSKTYRHTSGRHFRGVSNDPAERQRRAAEIESRDSYNQALRAFAWCSDHGTQPLKVFAVVESHLIVITTTQRRTRSKHPTRSCKRALIRRTRRKMRCTRNASISSNQIRRPSSALTQGSGRTATIKSCWDTSRSIPQSLTPTIPGPPRRRSLVMIQRMVRILGGSRRRRRRRERRIGPRSRTEFMYVQSLLQLVYPAQFSV